MERLKLFKNGESIATMKDLQTTMGVEISTYATEIITEEELYTSLYTLTFKYSEGLPYLADLKRNNFVRAYTNGQYNLYVINEVIYDTLDAQTEVHCVHYTSLYAGEVVPDLSLFSSKLTVNGVINKLNNSHYKSSDYSIRLAVGSGDTEEVDLTGFEFGNRAMGQMWTGDGSFLREHFGVFIIRDLQGITVINPAEQRPQLLPLTLGVNIKGLNYKLEEPERYTHAMVDLGSIPTIEVQGTGLEDTKRVNTGVANTNLTTFNNMDEGDEIQVFYKGLLLCIRKNNGSLTVQPYSEPRLIHTKESIGVEPLFHQNNSTTFNGTRLVVKQGDAGNEVTILDEDIDPTYLLGYRAFVNYKNISADPHGQVGTLKYFGFTPKPSNGVGSEGLDIIFSQINKELYKVPVKNPRYVGNGSNVYLVEYPEPNSDELRTSDKTWGFTEAYHFYRWFFNDFKGFWDSKEAAKLNIPKFKATVEVDALTSIFGVEHFNAERFKLGDRYQVTAQKQGFEFESEVTTIRYSVTEDELIDVEFGNYQLYEVEQVKRSTNSIQARRAYREKTTKSSSNETSTKSRSNTNPVINLADTTLESASNRRQAFINNLISATDKEDGDITHKVTITYSSDETQATYYVTDSDGNTVSKKAKMVSSGGDVDEDWLGNWLDDVMNGKDIRDEEDLFNGNLPYITRTDDTGIPRMEWEPPYVTISTDGSETTPTKLVCYNGAEAVIGEVRWKGEYNTVRVTVDGRFYPSSIRNFLPDNSGFTIVPYPDTSGGTRTWTPVFDLHTNEAFNKDTEHGSYQLTESAGSTPEDVALVKEELGYRYHYAINATTKGTVKFETERVMIKRYLNELSKNIRGNGTFGMYGMYQVRDLDEFKKEVLDRLQGQTIVGNNYGGDIENESQSLAYYLKQVDDGEQPYLKTIYRQLLKDILYLLADRVGYAPGEVMSFGDILKITVEFTGETLGAVRYKRIIGVEFDEHALEKQIIRDGPFMKEEQGWQRLIFTQPTTKVNDQTVKVNQLLITNDGVKRKEAAITKESIDELWKRITDAERKEFEDTYGREWLFNLKNKVSNFSNLEQFLAPLFRLTNNIGLSVAVDSFGMLAKLTKEEERYAKNISDRYILKYNFLVSKGYVVEPSISGQVAYDKIERHYNQQQQTPIEP